MQKENSKLSGNRLKSETENKESSYQELHNKQLDVTREDLFSKLTDLESKSSSVWTDFKNDIKKAIILAAILQYIAIVGFFLAIVLLFIRK